MLPFHYYCCTRSHGRCWHLVTQTLVLTIGHLDLMMTNGRPGGNLRLKPIRKLMRREIATAASP